MQKEGILVFQMMIKLSYLKKKKFTFFFLSTSVEVKIKLKKLNYYT